jgi:hypothetical protein
MHISEVKRFGCKFDAALSASYLASMPMISKCIFEKLVITNLIPNAARPLAYLMQI